VHKLFTHFGKTGNSDITLQMCHKSFVSLFIDMQMITHTA